jgi:putative membrane protein insertion efficiency factor
MTELEAPVHGLAHWVTRGLVFLIRGYQLVVSPVLPGACRFHPSCSQYARGAIEKHGPVRGLLLSIRRIGRCHPWGGSGYDPVR